MKIGERAKELHQAGFNCSQSVICALSGMAGIGEDTAKAIAGGFGGGLRCGEICGAVSGAVMALGLHCPYTREGDEETKARIAALTVEFTGKFREKFGALRCEELLAACGGKDCCNTFISWAAETAAAYIR